MDNQIISVESNARLCIQPAANKKLNCINVFCGRKLRDDNVDIIAGLDTEHNVLICWGHPEPVITEVTRSVQYHIVFWNQTKQDFSVNVQSMIWRVVRALQGIRKSEASYG